MINLLPNEDKKSVRQETTRRFFIVALSITSLFVMAGILLVLPIYFSLRVERESLGKLEELSKQSDKIEEIARIDKELNKLNLEANLLESASVKKSAGETLEKIIAMKPKSVTIDGFLFKRPVNSAPGELTLSGHAGTRENLVSFKESLEKSGLAENVDSPLSNILKKNDIEFKLVLKLKNE